METHNMCGVHWKTVGLARMCSEYGYSTIFGLCLWNMHSWTCRILGYRNISNEQLAHKRGVARPKNGDRKYFKMNGPWIDERSRSSSGPRALLHSGNAHINTKLWFDVTWFRSEQKMALTQKRSRPPHIRHRIETECETEVEKEALARRLQRMRELLSPDGSCLIDNGTLLNAMFNIVEWEYTGLPTAAQPATLSPSMMRNSGKSVAGSVLVIKDSGKHQITVYIVALFYRHIHRRGWQQTVHMWTTCPYWSEGGSQDSLFLWYSKQSMGCGFNYSGVFSVSVWSTARYPIISLEGTCYSPDVPLSSLPAGQEDLV